MNKDGTARERAVLYEDMGRGKEDCMKKMDKADNIFSKVFRWREILTGAFFVIILVAAAYAIFVLPYRYPPKEAADSASYAMGFNNTVSVIACIAAIALLSLAIRKTGLNVEGPAAVFNDVVRNEASTRMTLTAFWTLCVIYIAVNLLLYFAIPSLIRYGESMYFLRRINIFVRDGFTPYRHLEFIYGPALIYLPAAMTMIGKGFGMSMETAYLITYLGLLVLGLWLLYYVVNNLGCQDFYRTIIYILLAFFFLNVSFGLQCTPTRFVISFAAILWLNNFIFGRSRISASPMNVAIAGFLLPSAVLSISPEVGVVYLAAQTIFFLVAAFLLRRSLAWGAITGMLVLPMFVAVFSPEYLASLYRISSGGYNFPVVPAAHIVLYLIILFYTAPLLIACILSKGQKEAKPIMIAWAVLIVLMIPSALGRCDPGHVFTGGLGAILLMFALLGRRHPRMFTIYFTLFLLIVIVGHISEIYLYADQLWPVKQALCTGKRVEMKVEDPALTLVKNVKYGSIADPFALFYNVECYLRKEGRFLSESYPDTFDLFDQAAVDRKLEGLKNINAVMVPKSVLVFKDIDPRENLPPYLIQDMERDERKTMNMLFLYPVPYEMKYRRFNATFIICRYFATHFEPVIADENIMIMERVRQ